MAAGDPTGDDLCVGTTNGGTLPFTPTFEEREISLGAGTPLISGTKYAIVVRTAMSGSSYELLWLVKIPGLYSDGDDFYSGDSGITWNSGGNDNWFQTKADATVKDSYTPTSTGGSGVRSINWIAQTFLATSNYTITSVILSLAKYSLSPGTVTVSVRAVVPSGPQKVTTPAPIDTFATMTLDWQQFTWAAGGSPPDEEVYNVYFGTNPAALDLIVSQGNDLSIAQSYLQTVIGAGGYNTTYYWRVDSYWPSTAQTATGDVWSFSTIVFDFPPGGARGVGGGYGGDDGSGEAEGYGGGTFGDKQIHIKTRLIGFANNKLWYENL